MTIRFTEEIPEGAMQIHLYNFERVLRPRGSMKKESVGSHLLEKLNSYFESWTDKKYGDNPPKEELLKHLHENLMSEVERAWKEFLIQNSLE